MFELPGMKGISQTMTAASVLDGSIKVRMNPLQLRKAGAIIQNMQEAEYSDEQINHIARALFCDQSEEDMLHAWKVFDSGDKGELEVAEWAEKGELDATEFKKILPLMGEDVPPEEIELLFEQADTDGSGLIEFDEFVQLVRAMNPKELDSEEEEEEEEEVEEVEVELGPEEPIPGLVLTHLQSTRVFGVELKVLCFRIGSTGQVPEILPACIEIITQRLHTSDLLQPSTEHLAELVQLQRQIDDGQPAAELLDKSKPAVAVNLLFKWLDLLPSPVIPCELYETAVAAQQLQDITSRVKVLSSIVIALPPANCELICHVLDIAGQLEQQCEHNGCDAESLAARLVKSLLRKEEHSMGEDAEALATVTTLLQETSEVLNQVQVVLAQVDYDDTEEMVTELLENGTIESLQWKEEPSIAD